jgi:hypothetical protein
MFNNYRSYYTKERQRLYGKNLGKIRLLKGNLV